MQTVRIKTSDEYDVIIGSGAIGGISAALHKTLRGGRLLIVSDDNVAPRYLKPLIDLLPEYHISAVALKHGEGNKNLESVLMLLNVLRDRGFDRHDAVVALGGGVTGDMAAFAASIYMRGIDFVNIPTTLLSQVDSSIGGKTGIDFGGAKNLIGTFHQPKLVVCDTDYLSSLPKSIYSDGFAEVIKYAFINSPELLAKLEADAIIDDIVADCVRLKGEIVSGDEFDRGNRALLNFGHTVGHAVESLSAYRISHGRAVSIGMAEITAAAERAGLCENGVYARLCALLTKHTLPTLTEYSAAQLAGAIRSDKKVNGDSIELIIPLSLCRCGLISVKLTDLEKFLGENGGNGDTVAFEKAPQNF